MTKAQLVSQCYTLLEMDIRKGKWYAEDCDALLKNLNSKSVEQLEVILKNQKCINSISQKEMDIHCQTKGLFGRK